MKDEKDNAKDDLSYADPYQFFSKEQRQHLQDSLKMLLLTVTPDNFTDMQKYLQRLDEIINNAEDESHKAIEKLAKNIGFEQEFEFNFPLAEQKKVFFIALLQAEYDVAKQELESKLIEPSAKKEQGPKFFQAPPVDDLAQLNAALARAVDNFIRSGSMKEGDDRLVVDLMELVEGQSFNLSSYYIRNFFQINKESSFSNFLREELSNIHGQLSKAGESVFIQLKIAPEVDPLKPGFHP